MFQKIILALLGGVDCACEEGIISLSPFLLKKPSQEITKYLKILFGKSVVSGTILELRHSPPQAKKGEVASPKCFLQPPWAGQLLEELLKFSHGFLRIGRISRVLLPLHGSPLPWF